ncbi:MAG: indolepyruvate oxidoreductase subunit beta [Clostridia bacterium]|nr:indolepyruvate oxidoreductase subunit beta [Clostridia bacterium]
MTNTSVLIVGVGGQGTLLASRVLGKAALLSGLDVKISEVHGMSQRGGSVVTYVKYGERIQSPLIDRGCADVVLAFEWLEAYRALPYLKAECGRMIANTQTILPMSVINGDVPYPENLIEKMGLGDRLDAIDALEKAKACGSVKTVNSVMLGRFARYSDIPFEIWIRSIEETVPAKFVLMNKNAFIAGFSKEQEETL